MAIELKDALQVGGQVTINFLQFSIITQRVESLFLYLANEYRHRPELRSARALYDAFCGEKAIVKLSIPELLPPKSPFLAWELNKLITTYEAFQRFVPTEETPNPPRYQLPSILMYDPYVQAVLANPDSDCHAVAREFDPELAPLEHLPNEQLSSEQILFLQTVWLEKLKPCLVAGGFWQIASLGQI